MIFYVLIIIPLECKENYCLKVIKGDILNIKCYNFSNRCISMLFGPDLRETTMSRNIRPWSTEPCQNGICSVRKDIFFVF